MPKILGGMEIVDMYTYQHELSSYIAANIWLSKVV